MRGLPASIDELRGLRARRYVRVSSEEQGWKYGPEGQQLTIDESMRRLGLLEAGNAFVDETSAWAKSDQRPALRQLVAAAAAGEYDVLVVAYFSRWSRDAELALRLRRELHAAGVILWFADEGFASSDADAFERYLDEAVAAEKYSHRLSRTVKRTFKAKFERYGDQAGSPGLGFLRTPQPEARLAVDPATMPRAVALFERYAAGDISYRELAAWAHMTGGAVRMVLTNPLYNGWAVRHRRSARTAQVAAPWRSAPPVSDELWARVVEARAARAKAAGRQRAHHVHLLAKLTWCHCGRVVKADTSRNKKGEIVRRYVHEGCGLWIHESVVAHRLDDAIAGQVTGIRLDARMLERIRAVAGKPAPVDTEIRRAQLDRELRTKAAAHARRELTTEAYLAEHARLTTAIDELGAVQPTSAVAPIDDIIVALQGLPAAWQDADLEARAGLARRLYRRITVVNGAVREVDLTDWAKSLGLAIAMPEWAMARPAGPKRALAHPVRQRIRIRGRNEWLAASRTA